MEIRHQYDGKKLRISQGPGSEPSQTKQAFAKECDVNEILKKYEKTGLPPEMREGGQYGDFSSAPDYQSALHIVAEAQTLFDALPSKTRSEFNNDPSEFLAFCDDPKNAKRLIELGLATERKTETPSKGDPKPAEPASGASDKPAQASAAPAPVAGAK